MSKKTVVLAAKSWAGIGVVAYLIGTRRPQTPKIYIRPTTTDVHGLKLFVFHLSSIFLCTVQHI